MNSEGAAPLRTTLFRQPGYKNSEGAAMTTREKIQEWQQRKQHYELGGGAKAIEKLHAQGKLTARERIERFVDPGTFRELNLWAKPTRTGYDIDAREAPGDAAVMGTGKVDGRPVCLYAHDFTVLGGTQSSVQNWKVCKAFLTASKLRIPYVGIVDSGGVRVYDAFGVPAGRGVSNNADTWYNPAIVNGIVPSISVVLGASFAGTAYSPMLADVFFMLNKPFCYMSLSSPELLKTVTFVDVTREEIGGAKLHAEVTGSCDFLGETEEETLAKARELLSFLPSNYAEKPPILDTGDDPRRKDDALLDIIPNNPQDPFDMYEVIVRLVDKGHFLELKKDYAKNIITGFARLGGRSVGVVANNPQVLDGALDLKASEKEARFIRYCDAFNVPLVFLVDTPGFVADPEQEKQGLARHAAMAMYAICEATVPKITVYLRRCYKEGYFAMGTRLMGNDFMYAWPTAQIQLVDFKEAAEAVYRRPMEKVDSAQLAEFNKRFFDSPYNASGLLMLDDIINPRETRPILVDALETAARKEEVRPWRKHGNMPF